jgi:hypothetical protein
MARWYWALAYTLIPIPIFWLVGYILLAWLAELGLASSRPIKRLRRMTRESGRFASSAKMQAFKSGSIGSAPISARDNSLML